MERKSAQTNKKFTMNPTQSNRSQIHWNSIGIQHNINFTRSARVKPYKWADDETPYKADNNELLLQNNVQHAER